MLLLDLPKFPFILYTQKEYLMIMRKSKFTYNYNYTLLHALVRRASAMFQPCSDHAVVMKPDNIGFPCSKKPHQMDSKLTPLIEQNTC